MNNAARHVPGLIIRVARNVGMLLGSSGLASIFGAVALALNARALGPELLGVLALLQSLVGVLGKLFSFDTWQPVITLGARAQESGDSRTLASIVAHGLAYDFAAAGLATLTCLGIATFALSITGIAATYRTEVVIFTCTLILSGIGTSSGLLRLFDRFDIVAVAQLVVSGLSLIGAAVLFVNQAPFLIYVIFNASLIALQYLVSLATAAWIWRARGLPTLTWADLMNRGVRERFSTFAWSTWALSTVNVLRQNADIFVLAWIVGPAGSGIYKVALQISSALMRVADPLAQALYPEVAALAARQQFVPLKRGIVLAMMIGMFSLLVIGLGTWLFAYPIVDLVGGVEYKSAARPLLWLGVAYALALNYGYFRPAIINTYGPAFYLRIFLVAAAVFVPCLYYGIHELGVSGAGLSQVAYNVVWAALCTGALAARLDIRLCDFSASLSRVATILRARFAAMKHPVGTL